MRTYESMLIQRKTGVEWKDFAYPKNNVPLAIKDLMYFREKEKLKKFPAKHSLIKKTIDIFEI